jgi:hypothetical protein
LRPVALLACAALATGGLGAVAASADITPPVPDPWSGVVTLTHVSDLHYEGSDPDRVTVNDTTTSIIDGVGVPYIEPIFDYPAATTASIDRSWHSTGLCFRTGDPFSVTSTQVGTVTDRSYVGVDVGTDATHRLLLTVLLARADDSQVQVPAVSHTPAFCDQEELTSNAPANGLDLDFYDQMPRPTIALGDGWDAPNLSGTSTWDGPNAAYGQDTYTLTWSLTKLPDRDHDGHPDEADNCRDVFNPSQTDSDADGVGDDCTDQHDADGDGVPDAVDQCPGTPAGSLVNAVGCPLDTDRDGVPDGPDRCPGTPMGTPVDTEGCPYVLQGTIRYTYARGGLKLQPVRWAKVDVIVNGSVIGSATTDDRGAYAIWVNTNPGNRVIATTGLTVKVHADRGNIKIARSDTEVVPGPGDAFVANDDMPRGRHSDIFGVRDALIYGQDFLTRYASETQIRVVPDYDGSTSFWGPSTAETGRCLAKCIHIRVDDERDWDVVLHEFGHYAMERFGYATSAGGAHHLDQNLRETHDKQEAIELAWNEGWPTFFSMLVQREMNLAALGLPDVGDTRYDDAEPVADQTVHESVDHSAGHGEDNEGAVAAVLWDLYDATGPTGAGPDDDGVSWGATTTLGSLSAWQPHSLAELYGHIVAVPDAGNGPFRELFSAVPPSSNGNLVGPSLRLVFSSTGVPRALVHLGYAGSFNRLRLGFYDAEYHRIGERAFSMTSVTTVLDLSGGSFAAALQLIPVGGTINVVAEGTWTRRPSTGPYHSTTISLTRIS